MEAISLKVVEIISSLQGEGRFTGLPTTFIRLHGCNLQCSFCDADYANTGEYKTMTIPEIILEVSRAKNKYVCITGGEPLIQEWVSNLAKKLHYNEFKVSIETNGSKELIAPGWRDFSYCMDIKCPSSGMSKNNIYSNMNYLGSIDEVKFVVTNKKDYEFAKEVLEKYPTKAQVIISPVFNGIYHNGALIATWMMEDKLDNVRLGLQMHKILGIY